MTLAIVDYGVGNLRSVQRALERAGAAVEISADPGALGRANGIILPGVGAFGDGMRELEARGLAPALRDLATRGMPLLGICLGMQLLFEESEEMGRTAGLGLLRGRVRRFPAGLKVPHIGWNQVHRVRPSPLLAGMPQDSYAYFVHSYYVDPADPDVVLATTDYGGGFASVVGQGRLYGLQFHPEKSQEVGLRMLAAFVALASGEEPLS